MSPREWEVFVATAPGLEAVTAREVEELGFDGLHPEAGGIELRTSDEGLRRLNRELRTASRVLVRLASFRAASFGELERKARNIPWDRVLTGAPPAGPGAPRFEVTSRKSRLYHTGAVEERLRTSLDAWSAGRPSESTEPGTPGPRFVVRIVRDRLLLSADSSGEPLHRRGYRQAVAKAPLRETVAAALLLAGEWDARTPLFDPFCGSGTLIIEGALLAASIPPGARRRFGFERWPGFGGGADERAAGSWGRSDPSGLPPLVGADRDRGAVRAAQENAARAGVAEWVSWVVAPLSRVPFPALEEASPLPSAPAPPAPTAPRGLLVTNPPWGRRVGDTRTLRNLYARLGTLLGERWQGGRAVLLCPDPALAGQLGFPTRTLFRTRVGGIPVEALALDVL